jgi:hypothetical protein
MATGGSVSTGGGGKGGASVSGGAGGTSGAGGSGGSGGTSGSGGSKSTPKQVGDCNDLPAPGIWEEITPAGVETSDALTLDPFTDGTVWLGADPIGGGTPGLGGVFQSTDCGASFTHVNSGTNGEQVDNAHIWSMAIDYEDPGVMYVVGAYGPQGLWKSTNSGVDWTQLFPPDSEFAQTVNNNWVSSVSMDPEDPLHLVVGTHDNCSGAYAPTCGAETTDGGATWKLFKTTFLAGWAEQTGPYIIDASTFVFASVFDGTWLTTDHGSTWNKVTGIGGSCGGEFTHRPIWREAGTYYLPACNPDGLATSSDGRAWTPVTGVPSGGYPLGFAIGGGNMYQGQFNSWNYSTASLSAPTTWTSMPKPSAADSGRQGPVFLEYDESHHILYSANFTGGVWRIVTQ